MGNISLKSRLSDERRMRRFYSLLALVIFGVLIHLLIPHLFRAQTARDDRLRPQPPKLPSHGAAPKCTIWEDWREFIPGEVLVDDVGLPAPRLGTPEVLGGHSGGSCVPFEQRLGPFGHLGRKEKYIDRPWSKLNWGSLQRECADIHYNTTGTSASTATRSLQRASPGVDHALNSPHLDDQNTGRTAVVLRTWDAYEYYENQMAWMRTMTTELSLDTGGRFQVFILVDVKNQSLDLFNVDTYAGVLERSVPQEFRDMAILYNESLLREWFPEVGEYSAQDQMYQALQIFSFTFPEFDFVWQLEMDARFTGNVAEMLTNAGSWAQEQPRKNLWERNGRWYIQGLWEDYAAFSHQVDRELGNERGIWGPHPYAEFYVKPEGPVPPARQNLEWGVGEQAELITFAPLIDPANTQWTYEHTIRGFEPAEELPRRMAIISMTRTSRRLLRLISAEQRVSGAWVVSESTPETWSFLHGLKAVYAPHVVAFHGDESKVSPKQLDRMLHKGPQWSRAGGKLASFLWCDNDVQVPEHIWYDATYFYREGTAREAWWDYTNGTCTYPLLLHPVKDD